MPAALLSLVTEAMPCFPKPATFPPASGPPHTHCFYMECSPYSSLLQGHVYSMNESKKEGMHVGRRLRKRRKTGEACNGDGSTHQKTTRPMRPLGNVAGIISFSTMK